MSVREDTSMEDLKNTFAKYN